MPRKPREIVPEKDRSLSACPRRGTSGCEAAPIMSGLRCRRLCAWRWSRPTRTCPRAPPPRSPPDSSPANGSPSGVSLVSPAGGVAACASRCAIHWRHSGAATVRRVSTGRPRIARHIPPHRGTVRRAPAGLGVERHPPGPEFRQRPRLADGVLELARGELPENGVSVPDGPPDVRPQRQAVQVFPRCAALALQQEGLDQEPLQGLPVVAGPFHDGGGVTRLLLRLRRRWPAARAGAFPLPAGRLIPPALRSGAPAPPRRCRRRPRRRSRAARARE